MAIADITQTWWIVIGIAALLAIMAYQRKPSQKIFGFKRNMVLNVAVIAAVGIFAVQGGFLADLGLGGDTLSVTDLADDVALTSQVCTGGVEDTTVTLSAIDAETTVATGGNHRYSINDGPALTVADAGTFTASPGDKVDVLWINETTGAYFGAVSSFVVPCGKGTHTESVELYQNGTLTIEVFNEEGNLIDTAGENETLAAGDVVTLEMNLKGTYQRGIPYGALVAVEYNTTEFDDVIVDLGGSKYTGPTGFYTVNDTSHQVKFYTTSPIISNDIISGSITLDVDDSVNPASDDDVDLRVYNLDYYIDEDNGGAFSGPAVADEDDAVTRPDLHTFTLNVD